MKNLKKLTLLCMSMFLLLSGCSDNDYGLDPSNPTTITVWHYYASSQKIAFDKLVQEFNTTYGKEQGIRVEALSQGSINNLGEALLASAQNKVGAAPMPDVFSSYADTATEINAIAPLADVKEYLSKAEIEEYVEAYMNEGKIANDDRILLFPTAKATEVMFLNKTEWDKFADATGVTTDELKTWEGLIRVSEQYYTYSGGQAFFSRDALANYMLVGAKQLGNELFTIKDGKASLQLNEATIRKLWDNFYVPYTSGYFVKAGNYATDDLKTKDIIALVGSSSGATFFPTSVSNNENVVENIDYMILPVPNFEGHDPYVVQQGAGMAISETDETREYASILFLKWFSESSRNTAFAASASYLPVKDKANNPEALQATLKAENLEIKPIVLDTLKVSMEQIKNSTLYYSLPFSNSNQARNTLETSMMNKAKADRELILQAIAKGEGAQTVMATYQSDENFQQWYRTLSSELQTIIDNEK